MNKSTEIEIKNEYSCGKKGWLIAMVFVFVLYSCMDNFNRHGIIKSPLEVVFYVNYTIIQHLWLVWLIILFYSVQILQTFLIETMLSKELVSEKLGMTMHALNVFFVATVYLVVAIRNSINPLISRLLLTYVVYTMTKVWSFAYVNSKYRNSEIKKSDDAYPATITITNMIKYFAFTPSIEYEPTYPQRTKPNWKIFFTCIIKLLLIYYAFTFVLLQFILPEALELKKHGNNIMKIFGCALKLVLPVNIGWLLFSYENTYTAYLPAHAAITGMKDSVFGKDWWNSENLNVFWRKWNVPVHTALKCNVFVPLVKNGFTTTQAQLISVAIAGILHEYLNTLPMALYSGKAFFITMLEIPIGNVTAWIHKNYGPSYGNLSVWFYLLFTHTTAAVYYALTLSVSE